MHLAQVRLEGSRSRVLGEAIQSLELAEPTLDKAVDLARRLRSGGIGREEWELALRLHLAVEAAGWEAVGEADDEEVLGLGSVVLQPVEEGQGAGGVELDTVLPGALRGGDGGQDADLPVRRATVPLGKDRVGRLESRRRQASVLDSGHP